MKAKEAIPEFAARTGLPLSQVKLVDRALAEAGLRSKGRGPTPPSVTQADALRLLLGLAGAPVASRADEYVKDIQNFQAWFHNEELGDDFLRAVLGAGTADLKGMSFLNALLVVSNHLAKNASQEVPVWLEIKSIGTSEIAFEIKGKKQSLEFNGVRDVGPTDYAFQLTRYVGPTILVWIGDTFLADHETEFALSMVR